MPSLTDIIHFKMNITFISFHLKIKIYLENKNFNVCGVWAVGFKLTPLGNQSSDLSTKQYFQIKLFLNSYIL